MDLDLESAQIQERNFFLSQIKTRPFFLAKHIYSLANIIFDRQKTKTLLYFRGAHRGTKQKLPWKVNALNVSQCQDATLFNLIPERKLFLPTKDHPIYSEEIVNSLPDPEDYRIKTRWVVLIDSWLKTASPLFLPDNVTREISSSPTIDSAWETYSVCERIANLLTWISIIPLQKRQILLPQNTIAYLEQSLQWVLAHIEYYGNKTGNHIINNARCLLILGVVLKNQYAIKVASVIINNLLPVLIQPNGSLRERSSHYQLIVLTWLLDIKFFTYASELVSDITKKNLSSCIARMMKVAGILCDADGYLTARIGDISPDLSPIKTTQRLLACYPDFKTSISLKSERGAINYDDWWLLKNIKQHVLLNVPKGKYNYATPSHQHNDIPSFIWNYLGQPVFIDCGRARYTKDKISMWQKSMRGHNVPTVNGFAPLCESFVLDGNWSPLPYATVQIRADFINENTIEIRHNGFNRATPVTEHIRKIAIFEESIRVSDEFLGDGEVIIELLWQLAPGMVLIENNCLSFMNNKIIKIHSLCGSTLHTQLLSLESSYSRQYGYRLPHRTIRMKAQVKLPFYSHIEFEVLTCAQ